MAALPYRPRASPCGPVRGSRGPPPVRGRRTATAPPPPPQRVLRSPLTSPLRRARAQTGAAREEFYFLCRGGFRRAQVPLFSFCLCVRVFSPVPFAPFCTQAARARYDHALPRPARCVDPPPGCSSLYFHWGRLRPLGLSFHNFRRERRGCRSAGACTCWSSRTPRQRSGGASGRARLGALIYSDGTGRAVTGWAVVGSSAVPSAPTPLIRPVAAE